MITPDSNSGINPGNLPSLEAGPIDSGGGQLLPFNINTTNVAVIGETEPKTQNEMYLWKTWKQAEGSSKKL